MGGASQRGRASRAKGRLVVKQTLRRKKRTILSGGAAAKFAGGKIAKRREAR